VTLSPELTTEGGSSTRVEYRTTVLTPFERQPTLEFRGGDLPAMPVLISPAFITRFGGRDQRIEIGEEVSLELAAMNGVPRPVSLDYLVVGITDSFLGVDQDVPFLIAPLELLRLQLNHIATLTDYVDVNQVWLTLDSRQASPALTTTLEAVPGYVGAEYAWDVLQQAQREPLANAIMGMLFAGFWVSLGLILLDFAFYIAITTRRRTGTFAVLRSMGWENRNVWRMLTLEQAAFITPALFVGILLGTAIAWLILPFLAQLGGRTLQIPLAQVGLLLTLLIVAFTLLLSFMTLRLRRASLGEMQRLNDYQ
jgi:hypothetical protein